MDNTAICWKVTKTPGLVPCDLPASVTSRYCPKEIQMKSRAWCLSGHHFILMIENTFTGGVLSEGFKRNPVSSSKKIAPYFLKLQK